MKVDFKSNSSRLTMVLILLLLSGALLLGTLTLLETPDVLTMENRKVFTITLKEQYKNSLDSVGIINDTETENASIKKTFEMLSPNIPLKYQVNAYNDKQTGIGFIDGSEYDNTNKAMYLFTEEPNKETIPYGILYTIIKDNTITIGMGTKPQEKDTEITIIED